MKRGCGLRRAAIRAIEQELGSHAHNWSHVLALLDPRYKNLFVLPDTTVLIVPDRRIDEGHLDLVSEPGNHYGLPYKKIVYAHHWAECVSISDDDPVDIRRIDDATCAEPPAWEVDWNGVARRRGLAGCLIIPAALVSVPYLAKRFWSVPLWVSVPLLLVVLLTAPLVWSAALRRKGSL